MAKRNFERIPHRRVSNSSICSMIRHLYPYGSVWYVLEVFHGADNEI
jgi:hypothetical protein